MLLWALKLMLALVALAVVPALVMVAVYGWLGWPDEGRGSLAERWPRKIF